MILIFKYGGFCLKKNRIEISISSSMFVQNLNDLIWKDFENPPIKSEKNVNTVNM